MFSYFPILVLVKTLQRKFSYEEMEEDDGEEYVEDKNEH